MILCLLGTNPYQFDRLASAFDQACKSLNLEGFIQLGNTNSNSKNCHSFDFKARSEIQELISKADLIVTQGGYGSMMDVLEAKKPLIAVPRLIQYGECLDDQTELVNYWEEKGFLLSCSDIDNLELAITSLLNKSVTLSQYQPETSVLISEIIFDFLDQS